MKKLLSILLLLIFNFQFSIFNCSAQTQPAGYQNGGAGNKWYSANGNAVWTGSGLFNQQSNNAPAASAALELQGTTKGFLINRMTAAQKNAIASPATGLLIYQTNSTPGFYAYDGASWAILGGGGGGTPTLYEVLTAGNITSGIPLQLDDNNESYLNNALGNAQIYSNANNCLQFNDNTGSEVVTIKSGGYLGINNNDPQATLALGNPMQQATYFQMFGGTGNDFLLYSYPEDANIFKVNGDDNVTLFNEGNTNWRHIFGGVGGDYPVTIRQSGTMSDGSVRTQFGIQNSDSEVGIRLDNLGTNGRNFSITSTGGGSLLGDGNFCILQPSTGVLSLKIDGNGYVYIPTRLNISDAYTMPTSDGTAGQAIVTDGSGNTNWSTPLGNRDSISVGYGNGDNIYSWSMGSGLNLDPLGGGAFNVLLGSNTGTLITTGGANVMIGYSNGSSNVDGYNNTFVGSGNAGNGSTGNNNTVIGTSNGSQINSNNNTFVGAQNASGGIVNGTRNTYIGINNYSSGVDVSKTAMLGNDGLLDSYGNIAIGNKPTAFGRGSIAIGDSAIANGDSSTVVGHLAYAGLQSVSIGSSSRSSLFSVAIGNLSNATGDSYGVSLGYNTKSANSSISIGGNSGTIGTTPNYSDSQRLTLLGYNTGFNGTTTNSTAIGADVLLTDNNTVILGNNCNIGIGTTNPVAKLEVDGTVKILDGSQQTGYVLTSNSVGLATWSIAPSKTVVSADLTAQSAAVASVATYTPAGNATLRIGGYINITATTAGIVTLKVTYTDINSQAVTQIIPLTIASTGAVGTTATVLNSNNSATDIQIRAKAGNAVTVLTTLANVATYDVGATIEFLR